MTRFLKLTQAGADKRMLVNIAHIREMEERSDGGTVITFNNDSWCTVIESFDTIIKMITNEEVVK